MEALTSDPRHYPLMGRASILACPVHDCVVALNDEGRIASRCPECLREQRRARSRWSQRRWRERMRG